MIVLLIVYFSALMTSKLSVLNIEIHTETSRHVVMHNHVWKDLL